MNTLNTSTLRPGLLVSLKTTVSGNVTYTKQTLESDRVTEDGGRLARWETERTIADAKEHEAAQIARSACYTAIRRVCTQSAFGLLCPEDKARDLESAMTESRQIAERFNSAAKLSRLNVYIMTGRIAPDDVEAVKAINSEVRDLMAEMERGLANIDVKVVRQAAAKAKSVGAMLSPNAAARVQVAIDAARESAKRIVKAGEQVAGEVDLVTIKRIAEQRTSFIDMDGEQAVNTGLSEQGRAIDLAPDESPALASVGRSVAIELETDAVTIPSALPRQIKLEI